MCVIYFSEIRTIKLILIIRRMKIEILCHKMRKGCLENLTPTGNIKDKKNTKSESKLVNDWIFNEKMGDRTGIVKCQILFWVTKHRKLSTNFFECICHIKQNKTKKNVWMTLFMWVPLNLVFFLEIYKRKRRLIRHYVIFNLTFLFCLQQPTHIIPSYLPCRNG